VPHHEGALMVLSVSHIFVTINEVEGNGSLIQGLLTQGVSSSSWTTTTTALGLKVDC